MDEDGNLAIEIESQPMESQENENLNTSTTTPASTQPDTGRVQAVDVDDNTAIMCLGAPEGRSPDDIRDMGDTNDDAPLKNKAVGDGAPCRYACVFPS